MPLGPASPETLAPTTAPGEGRKNIDIRRDFGIADQISTGRFAQSVAYFNACQASNKKASA
jgi:hypothetical protein